MAAGDDRFVVGFRAIDTEGEVAVELRGGVPHSHGSDRVERPMVPIDPHTR